MAENSVWDRLAAGHGRARRLNARLGLEFQGFHGIMPLLDGRVGADGVMAAID
jgi:hypothetical protein